MASRGGGGGAALRSAGCVYILVAACGGASSACSAGHAPAPSPAVSVAQVAMGPDAATAELRPADGRVAVGARHSCAVDAAGRVRCWGANDHGQLGDGTRRASATPVTVASLDGVKGVAAAANRTCALTADGKVACWGEEDGRDVLRPAVIEGLAGVSAISVEASRLCVVLRSGTAFCLGTRWLGDGAQEHRGPAVLAEVAGMHDVAAIAGGCVLSRDGSARCWGSNRNGEAGDGTREPRTVPVRVPGLDDLTAIAAGSEHVCALRGSGVVVCWGRADKGQAGDGTTAAHHLAPSKVPGVEGARAIAAAGSTTCAALASGEVTCWGGGVLGTLAAGTDGPAPDPSEARVRALSPVRVPELRDAASIAVGEAHACALTGGGAVWCWGENLDGQLGTGVAGSAGGLVAVTEFKDATRVAAGDAHTCALTSGGAVWCWGDGRRGQLGDGTLQSRGAPALVAGVDDAIALAADAEHTCAVRRAGTVACWGARIPQLGEAPDPAAPWRAPTEVPHVRDVKRLALGRERACALLTSGRVACWGEDALGALGLPPIARRGRLTPIAGLTGVESVAMGAFGACATTSAGALWCWGAGAITAWAPRSGDDKPVQEANIVKPAAVSSVRDAAGVGLDSLLACVARKGGRVACWDTETRALVPQVALTRGDEVSGLEDAVDISRDMVVRRSGEVGTIQASTQGARWVYERVAPGLDDAVTAARGVAHACAVRRSGEVVCWGDDGAGQLGAGAHGRSHRPLRVTGLP
ncbi:RCC1 domain-containing protein [Polyangium fumosum]|nr:RCC1 domain-containing protein [Polyangium fumosum]